MEEPVPYLTGRAQHEDPTRARLLDATFACAERFGIGRLTMGDVAKQAALSRQTVYRYFPTKHDLIAAVVHREEERIIQAVRGAVAPFPDLEPALRAAFTTCLRTLRAHPLLDKVLANEPAEILPFLTVEASPVNLGLRLMHEVLAPRAPHAAEATMRRAADVCARAFISYAIVPPEEDLDEVASQLAALIAGGLTCPKGRVQ